MRSCRSHIGAGEQFTPEFLAITPNHRIPAIVDPDGPGGKPIPLFESGAILVYLAEKTGSALLPDRPGHPRHLPAMADVPDGRHRPDVRPVQPLRQLRRRRSSPTRSSATATRCARLHRVLDKRLGESAYLAGAGLLHRRHRTFPWIRNPDRRNIDLAHYPNVLRWHDAIAARPAVQRGVAVLAENQRRAPMTEAERENMFGKTQFAAR